VDRVLECLPRGGRVAVIRLRSLGDSVLTTPAIGILKRSRPDLRIAVAVESRFRAVFEDNPDIERILEPGIGAVRRWRPALCLNFHGGTRSAWMTALSGACFRAGFGHYRAQFAYNVRIPRAQQILRVERKVHTAEHLASAMFYLGAAVCEIPRASLYPAEICQAAGNTAVIHAVAATPAKTWPADRFIAVAHHLRECGLDPVFIGTAADHLAPFREFRTMAGASLSEIKRLLASASLFVGNDSGPAHMAAAFGLPVIVIFGPSDPEIWSPWRTPSEVLSSPAGIESVPVSDVIQALTRLRVAA
jgi:heptosyltransferase III